MSHSSERVCGSEVHPGPRSAYPVCSLQSFRRRSHMTRFRLFIFCLSFVLFRVVPVEAQYTTASVVRQKYCYLS